MTEPRDPFAPGDRVEVHELDGGFLVIPVWHCICGAGDDAEFHSILCVGSNTPDEEWQE